MELAQGIRIIRKNIILIAVIALISAASGFLFYRLRPLTYDVFCAITVSQDREDKTEDYKYDNYYSQQAIDTFTDSLEKWFGDAQMISDAYGKAGISLEKLTIRQRSKLIKARKLGPQYIELRFNVASREDGIKISKGVVEIVGQRIEELRGDRQVWFEVSAREPLIIESRWNPILAVFAAFFGGACAGVFISFVKFYLEGQEK